jgi:NitT/TauT family transport system permease protein
MSRRARLFSIRLLLTVAILAAWQWLSSAHIIDPFFFSRPGDIAARIYKMFAAGAVWMHLAVTLEEAFLALLLGSIGGIAAGFLLGRSAFLSDVLEPFIQVLNALPRVVLAPLFLLWFGLGIWSKVALGVSLVFFIVFFSAWRAVRDVEPALIHNALMLGASERQLIAHVILPSALSAIWASLNVSLGMAMVGAVVGEYLGASRGIGYLIAQSEGLFDSTGVFAGMAVLSLVTVCVSAVAGCIERWALRWKASAEIETQGSQRFP